jgi:hypothetical protein
MSVPPLATIAVGVIVERSKAESRWLDYHWRPTTVLAGQPDTTPWTKLAEDGDRSTFYAGSAEIGLYRTEAGHYRENLATGAPLLWVVLRESSGPTPYQLHLVTADPAEGEGATGAGNDIVEAVPMPDAVRDRLAAFVAEHHVEDGFIKRVRDRADPEALGRRLPGTQRDDE